MTKQELKAIPRRELTLSRMRMQLAYLQEKATSTAVPLREKVQTSPATWGNIYAEDAADLAKEIAKLQNKQNCAKRKANRLIDLLSDPAEQRIMRLRYCGCRGWEDIADTLGYTRRHTIRLHGNVLKRWF